MSTNEQRGKSFKADNVMENSTSENRLREVVDELFPQAESYNYSDLILLCERGFLNQVVQSWSYFAQVNNHVRFGKLTNLLFKTLVVLGRDTSVEIHGSALIKLILEQYAKVMYRGLSSMRRGNTIPTLKLMKQIIHFGEGKHLQDFLSYFDLKLSIIPKILTPSKAELNEPTDAPSYREYFISFFIELIAKAPTIIRKDILMDNYKILSAWFKFMDKADSHEILLQTITLFINSILLEPSFKKMTKTKVLNEMVLMKLHTLYYAGDKTLKKKVNEFFKIYGSDPVHSVAFTDDCVWFKTSPYNNDQKGVTITINQRNFTIYNKLLFNLLKIFKPWDDVMQTNTVVSILKNVPELVAPYSHYLLSLGNHDPNITSYWSGLTLLYGKIIRLDIPKFMTVVETDEVPDATIVIESIIPAPLSKGSSTKTLQYDNYLVKMMGAQLLVFSFQKLRKVFDLYEMKGWSSKKLELSSLFLSRIPEMAVISNALNQVYSNSPKLILLLTLTMILREYAELFPNLFSLNLPSSNIFMDILAKESFNEIEFAILDNFLKFQPYCGSQTKWWTSTESQRSLFTSMILLGATKDLSIRKKVETLLDGLIKNTIIFSTGLIKPIAALINSLEAVCKTDSNGEQINKIATLLDSSIMRCINTPYKYSDKATNFNQISPFIVTLTEQWKFVDKSTDYDLVLNWLMILTRNLWVVGESRDGILALLRKELPEFTGEINDYFDINIYSNNENCIKENDHILKQMTDQSFFQMITLSSVKELSKGSARIPTSQFDCASLFFYLELIILDANIAFDKICEHSIMNAISMIDGYLQTDLLEACIAESEQSENALSLVTVIKDGRVECDDSSKLIAAVIDKTELLSAFFQSNYFDEKKIESYISVINSPSPCLALHIRDVTNNPIATEYVYKVADYCIKNLNNLTDSEMENFLKIIVEDTEILNQENLLRVSEFALEEYHHKFRAVNVLLVRNIVAIDDALKKKWLTKLVLYITKYLSERENMNFNFKELIKATDDYFSDFNIWENVAPSLLNTQLEVILQSKWISNTDILHYLIKLTLGSSKKIASQRVIQLLLNNENITLNDNKANYITKYLTALLINSICATDIKNTCTTLTLRKCVSFYRGSLAAHDRVLLNVIETAEAQTGSSWINDVITWDYIQNAGDVLDVVSDINLISQINGGFVVTLRKDFIENTCKFAGQVGRPNFTDDFRSELQHIDSNNNDSFFDSINRTPRNVLESCYDPYALMLISIQNDELVQAASHAELKESVNHTYRLDVQKFLDAALFQVVITCLAWDGTISDVANIILKQLLISLSEIKETSDLFIFKLLLQKIIFSIEHAKARSKNFSLPKIVFHFISRLIPLLMDPANPLYESAYRWVLDSPFIRSNEIPLTHNFIEISESGSNHETYFKQLVWVLESLEQGIIDKHDLGILKSKGVLDWLLSLPNINCLSVRIQGLISSIIYRLQRIENGGVSLITRFAGISSFEMRSVILNDKLREAKANIEKNDKNTNHQRQYLVTKEQQLASEEILEGFATIIQSQKRLREWTNYDEDNILKRICHSK
ncbi:Nucleolar pre-ribosomal-associated protein 1 [Nakaseomyces glabratus]|uniref:Nucleolar pre-ribosomal-associated protein 1 n=1 Tax=Candida glabrata TaxID=5478 RepID=A0A0W0CED3_CANGB|nr:Nucleolar pre-ribosomal-associated protein 1 [Nakaseomyces glabratus]